MNKSSSFYGNVLDKCFIGIIDGIFIEIYSPTKSPHSSMLPSLRSSCYTMQQQHHESTPLWQSPLLLSDLHVYTPGWPTSQTELQGESERGQNVRLVGQNVGSSAC
jgi:hypothetical protein